MKSAPNVFLTLSADGVEDVDQRSRSRRALLVVSAVLLLCAPLAWTVTAEGSVKAGPDAVANKPVAQAADSDDDDSGSGGGDSGSGAGGSASASAGGSVSRGASSASAATSDLTRGDVADSRTRGATVDFRDRATGRETAGGTDFPARADTGLSTVGETDPGDLTGVTERR